MLPRLMAGTAREAAVFIKTFRHELSKAFLQRLKIKPAWGRLWRGDQWGWPRAVTALCVQTRIPSSLRGSAFLSVGRGGLSGIDTGVPGDGEGAAQRPSFPKASLLCCLESERQSFILGS